VARAEVPTVPRNYLLVELVESVARVQVATVPRNYLLGEEDAISGNTTLNTAAVLRIGIGPRLIGLAERPGVILYPVGRRVHGNRLAVRVGTWPVLVLLEVALAIGLEARV
jgi:hypothetical protein